MTRQRLEVVGAIQPGARVQGASGALDQAEVLALVDVLRALEHHVLEEVREAGLAGLFVLACDVVPQVDGDHRRAVIPRQDHAQAIFQAMAIDGDGRHGLPRLAEMWWLTAARPAGQSGQGRAERTTRERVSGRRACPPPWRRSPRVEHPSRRRARQSSGTPLPRASAPHWTAVPPRSSDCVLRESIGSIRRA